MKNKPDLGFWKLWNLSFGFFGVQIAYALQSANVSRIFTTIGADPHDLSYFWILPPLMGLIVQPIVGVASDRTWTRFGRRLPYLIIGALIAVIVMCLLPNSGSFHLSVDSAILFGLVALMVLDTSINMAMQPFKMLVGDMVNDRQKGKAYSIQSFLCNAGSIVGYIFPMLLMWFGIKNIAPAGVVPDTVIWSFYLGAAILLICVVYSLIKIKEWPPKEYDEYNGGNSADKNEKKENIFVLLAKAPKTFWTVGLVQFFCWFAFLFLWTYGTNTVAYNAFDTPSTESYPGIKVNGKDYKANYILAAPGKVSGNGIASQSYMIVEHGHKLVSGVQVGNEVYNGGTIVVNGNDTIVNDHKVVTTAEGLAKFSMNTPLEGVKSLSVDGKDIELTGVPVVKDYLEGMTGEVTITTAAICAANPDGTYTIDDAKSEVVTVANSSYISKTVLNAATPQYNAAGNWVGLLFAVQAVGSVIWAVLLPRLGSRRFSYVLSLMLGAVGFAMTAFMTNQYWLFVAFLLIGCAWAAMLAWPFTILTNSLKGGNIGTYLGLFNGTICLPQIIAAVTGGWILSLLSKPGQLAPEYLMMLIAAIAIALGALCVFFIREDTPAANR